MVEVRREVRPAWPFRLPRAGRDGVLRRGRDGGLERLLHVDGPPRSSASASLRATA